MLVGLAVDAPRAPFRSYGFAWPDVLDKALESIPSGSAVLTYPYPTDALWSEAMLWQAQQQMSFRLLGGYATIQVLANTSQYWPLLAYPDYVQEFLVEEQNGAPTYYPPFDAATGPDGVGALCLYLNLWSVNAVVYWQSGVGALAVQQYFERALGKPGFVEDGVRVWRRPYMSCM